MKLIKNGKQLKNNPLAKSIVAIVLLALVLSVIPAFVQADREAKIVTLPTSDASKREVVYARLKATGMSTASTLSTIFIPPERHR